MFNFFLVIYIFSVLLGNLVGRIFYNRKYSSPPTTFDVFLVFVPVFNLVQTFVFLCEISSIYLNEKQSNIPNWFFGIKK